MGIPHGEVRDKLRHFTPIVLALDGRLVASDLGTQTTDLATQSTASPPSCLCFGTLGRKKMVFGGGHKGFYLVEGSLSRVPFRFLRRWVAGGRRLEEQQDCRFNSRLLPLPLVASHERCKASPRIGLSS